MSDEDHPFDWGRNSFCLREDQRYVVIDLETTGLDCRRHKIIEIAALRITPGVRHWPGKSWLVRQPRRLPQRIVDLTGITDDLLEKSGGDACEAVTQLVDFVGSDPIVAFNASFDLGFLNAACECHAVAARTKGGFSCALKLARRAWPGLSGYSLSNLADIFDLPAGGKHRAVGDAFRAGLIYELASAVHRERLAERRARRQTPLGYEVGISG